MLVNWPIAQTGNRNKEKIDGRRAKKKIEKKGAVRRLL